MALATCKECGAQVSTEAKTCPSCGVKAPTKHPAAPQQSTLTRKRTMSPTVKVLLGVAFVGLVANVVLGGRRHSPPSSSDNGQSAFTPVDACFDQGANVAKVYFANIKTATEVGSTASDMMATACRDAVQKIGTRDCLGQCEAGFKYTAKNWVKGKP